MSSDVELGPRLRRRLTYLFKHALLHLEDLHAEHLAATGLNVRELTVLMFLDGREPESQQQAAASLGVDRTTMVGVLDSLERKGLVARQPDAGDRRRNVVALSDVGRQTLRTAEAASDEAESRLLDALDETEARQLRELLGRIAARPTPG